MDLNLGLEIVVGAVAALGGIAAVFERFGRIESKAEKNRTDINNLRAIIKGEIEKEIYREMGSSNEAVKSKLTAKISTLNSELELMSNQVQISNIRLNHLEVWAEKTGDFSPVRTSSLPE